MKPSASGNIRQGDSGSVRRRGDFRRRRGVDNLGGVAELAKSSRTPAAATLRSSAWWGRSVEAPADAVALIHLLETTPCAAWSDACAGGGSLDVSTCARGREGPSAVERGRLPESGPRCSFPARRAPRRAAEWSPDEIDESVDATMVLSDASQRDFGDRHVPHAGADDATERRGDGRSNGGGPGASSDILRALEEGGTLPGGWVPRRGPSARRRVRGVHRRIVPGRFVP